MGYRSDVAVVFEAKDTDKLLKAAKDWDKKYNLDGHFTVENLIDDADKNMISKDKKYHLLVWNSIEWYAASIADITGEKIHKNQEFFESLNDYGIKYDLVRIGEEMGDSVILGNLGSGVALMTYENEMTAISAS